MKRRLIALLGVFLFCLCFVTACQTPTATDTSECASDTPAVTTFTTATGTTTAVVDQSPPQLQPFHLGARDELYDFLGSAENKYTATETKYADIQAAIAAVGYVPILEEQELFHISVVPQSTGEDMGIWYTYYDGANYIQLRFALIALDHRTTFTDITTHYKERFDSQLKGSKIVTTTWNGTTQNGVLQTSSNTSKQLLITQYDENYLLSVWADAAFPIDRLWEYRNDTRIVNHTL